MISIAMATYNGEDYLREQLDSILSQTVTDWELVACDDSSTDGTLSILNEYAARDGRIRVHVNENNLGFKKNFEKAISLCTGDYIALCDQDDIWYTNHLEYLLNNIADKSMSGANAVLIDKEGRDLNRRLNEADNFLFMPEGDKFLFRVILTSGPIQGASMLVRRDFLRRCLPIPEPVKFHDAWFVACACLDCGISYSFEPISKYRQHGNNVTFFAHNGDNRSISAKIKSRLKILFKGLPTDRFCYCRELKSRYGLGSRSFSGIYNTLEDIRLKKNRVRTLVFLWKNYFDIATQKTHKGFFKQYVIWNRWHEHD